VTVIVGLPGDGVPQLLRDAVVASAHTGGAALLAVPAATDAVKARSLITSGTPVGVRVATLRGVVEAEWALVGDGRRLVGGLGRDVLLARALVAAGVTARPGPGAIAVLGALAERAVRGFEVPVGDALPDRIVRALATYAASLDERGLIERGEACALLALEAPPAAVIAVDGFVRLPHDFETLLVGWGSRAEVVLSLPGSLGHDTVTSWPLLARLAAAGACIRPPEAGRARSAELDRISRDLFTAAAPGTAGGDVRLAVTEGEEGEARYAAAVAAELVAGGADPGGIVIAFADPGRHAVWMRRALRDAGVEADVRATVGVGETPFGAALLNLRTCATGGLSRRDLGALVRSTFSGVPIATADGTDAAWRRGGSSAGRGLLRHIVVLDPVISEVLELAHAPIGEDEARRWKKLADWLLANGYPGAAPVPAEDGYLDAAAHRAFCRGLQEALELGAGEVTADELWDRFAATRVEPSAARRPGSVLVTGIESVPTEGAAHVIVGGLTASECPRRGSADRFEGDALGTVLGRLGIDPDEEGQSREERRAFLLAVAAAEAGLTLVRRATDDEGAPLRESVFWDEFLDLYRRPGEPVPAGKPLVETVTLDPAGRGGRARTERGALSDDRARSELASLTEVSPSEVESYLSCPYKWFVERRLRAHAPDREIDVAAVGGLAHAALASFYREWQARGQRRVTPPTSEAAARLAAEIADDVLLRAGRPEDLETATLLDSIRPAIVALIERDADFLPGYEPAQVEWAFGRDSGVPALDLGGGVALVGRADRVDVGPDGLVIVDYKRTTAHPLAQIRARGLVQLQLYAAAASEALSRPVAGGLYRGLKEGVDRGFVLDGVSETANRNDVIDAAEMAALIEEAVASAVDAASRMRSGHIAPTPSPESCRFCSAAPFCGQAVSR